jgi:undecaprenyl-diphosphatase
MRLDEPLRSAIAGSSPPGRIPPLGHYFAALGNWYAAGPVLVAAMAYSWWRSRRWVPVAAYAVAMAAVPLLVAPLKTAVGRTGGTLIRVPDHAGLYPSGHAATAALGFGAAALLVLPFLARKAARRLLGAAAVLLNAGVGVALVYCGYHWPLDVAGSWLLCGALLSGAAWAARRWAG